MKKEVRLLDHGLFEKAFYGFKGTYKEQYRQKEIAFGHLIGPLGLILIVNTIAALVEKILHTADRCYVWYGKCEYDSYYG